MKPRISFTLGILMLTMAMSISACEREKTVCPPPTGSPKPRASLADLMALPTPYTRTAKTSVEIAGKIREIDKLVDYPLCNDNWMGTVYVSCEAQVAEAETDANDNPLFLQGCELRIAPNTVVYVAAHNDAAYYKGCSCHTGEDPLP